MPADITPEQLRRERGILLTLVAVQFISIVDFMMIMPLGPQLMRTMKLEPSEFGIVVSSYTVAAGIAGFIASSLIDRFDRRHAFLTLYAGFLAGTLACGLAPNYLALVCTRVLTGLFGGILGGVTHAIVGDIFPDERRGRAMGALMMGFSLASVAGVPIGIAIGTRYTWHATFYLLAGSGLLLLPLAWRVVPSLRAHVLEVPQHPLRTALATFREPTHLIAFGVMVSVMVSSFAVVPFLSTYVVMNVGLAENSLPWLYMVGGACTLLTSPLIGRWADSWGKYPVFRLLIPFSAAIMLLITLIPRGHQYFAIGATAVLMVVNSGRMIAGMALITSSIAPARRGGFMSANASIQHLSAGIGAFISGHVVTRAASGELQHFPVVGTIAAVVALASLECARRIRPLETSAQSTTVSMSNEEAVVFSASELGGECE